MIQDNTDFIKYNTFSTKNNTSVWEECCSNGNLELMQYLDHSSHVMNKPSTIYFDKKSNAWEFNFSGLNSAIIKGHIDIVKYIFSLPIYQKHVITSSDFFEEFIGKCCAKNQSEVLSFFLDSGFPVNIKKDPRFINWVLTCKFHETFKVLVSSPNNKFDFSSDDYNILKNICQHQDHFFINFLIIDLNINIPKKIIQWLKGENEDKYVYEHVLKIIQSKELYQKLSNEIIPNDNFGRNKVKV